MPPERDYYTAAGYVLSALGRLPATGEHVKINGWRFEVVDLDGNRIDKLIASPCAASEMAVGGLPCAVPHRLA